MFNPVNQFDTIIIGDTLNIDVTDTNLNTSGTSAQNYGMSVEVRNAATGETENAAINESGNNNSLFLGDMIGVGDTLAIPSNNGTLYAQMGGTIEVRYNDPLDANDSVLIVLRGVHRGSQLP